MFSTGTLPCTRFFGPGKNRLENIELVDIDGESGLSNDDQNPEIEFVEEIIYVTTINIVLGYFRSRVMRVGSDTFSDPIFQKGLQN